MLCDRRLSSVGAQRAALPDRKRSISGFHDHDHLGLGMPESAPCPLIAAGFCEPGGRVKGARSARAVYSGCPGAFRPLRIIPHRAAVGTGGLGTPSTRVAFDPCRGAAALVRTPGNRPAGPQALNEGQVLRIWRMVAGSPVRCRARRLRCAEATRRGRGRFLAHI